MSEEPVFIKYDTTTRKWFSNMDSDTVYVQIGRGNGKHITMLRQIEKLIGSGKKVVLIEPKLVAERTKHIPYSNGLIDLDILDPGAMERAEKMLNTILKGE